MVVLLVTPWDRQFLAYGFGSGLIEDRTRQGQSREQPHYLGPRAQNASEACAAPRAS
jgi:hypothetical protein